MGIHGIFKQIGAGERISLAKLSADHYTQHSRPFRLAIDISIWLFQIQSGKGGSNPALRTFYYRLLRLITLNIHPLFVFDGPNKPLFKRNKKVGGPGVRVASVPEFLAKQLLKQFGFPWHVAPGEAEAECALLQREGVVDAVLSEDVDTLMFGSGVTLRNWTSENSTKSPTHVNVYRASETKERSGMDREGMILVALMSGGDYLPEGIPGCGPKVACDAARAGFGVELCALSKRDVEGLSEWKERLQLEIRTNQSKSFSRKNTGFTIPEDFPNAEVLGYYTHPCVSTPDKVERLRESLRWDQGIDFPALRLFTADAFDWRCLGGAKKFIRNLAPAMLVRELRLQGEADEQDDSGKQEAKENLLVKAIHGKRNHPTTDGSLEYRISFTPANLVSIDLSLEDEDDDFLPAGGDGSDAEDDSQLLPPSTAASEADEAEAQPASPSKKKRTMRPYDPSQPEKVWILKPFLQIGCPLLVEEYEASFRDPKELLKQRRKAKAVTAGKTGKGKKKAANDMPANALMAFTKVTKAGAPQQERLPLKETNSQGNEQPMTVQCPTELVGEPLKVSAFKLPTTQIPPNLFSKYVSAPVPSAVQHEKVEVVDLDTTPRPFARFANKAYSKRNDATNSIPADVQKTPPRRKRRSPELSSPIVSQRTITSYYSPSPRKTQEKQADVFVNLISSSPAKAPERRSHTPTPPNIRHRFIRSPGPENHDRDQDVETLNLASSPARPAAHVADLKEGEAPLHSVDGGFLRSPSRRISDFSPGKLPDTVTKRRKKGPLRRHQTAPVEGEDSPLPGALSRAATPELPAPIDVVEAMDLASPSPVSRRREVVVLGSDDSLPSPESFLGGGRLGRKATKTGQDVPQAGPPASSLPTPPAEDVSQRPHSPLPPPAALHKPTPTKPLPNTTSSAPRRSPRQQSQQKKRAILLRQSLEGAWKEVDAENVDLSGDGSGFRQSKGKAKMVGAWRKSGVEVLDLTGA